MSVAIGAFDRSNEFRACVQFFQQQALSGRVHLRSRPAHGLTVKSEPSSFLTNAKTLLVELSLTRTKFHKLVLLLEPPESSTLSPESHKLIDIIRCDLVDLNKSMNDLKEIHTQIQSKLTRQMSKHNRLLITCLELHLSDLVKSFRTVLERNATQLSNSEDAVHPIDMRQESNECASSLTTACTAATNNQPILSSPSFQPDAYNHVAHRSVPSAHSSAQSQNSIPAVLRYPTSDTKSSTTILGDAWNKSTETSREKFYITPQTTVPTKPFEQPFMLQADQLQLHAPPDQHLRQRDANIKRVESTIIQLGEIYQQFSYLVKEQSDIVGRIDSHTEDTDFNVNSAHEHLLLYLRAISTRRSLMIKIFVTLLIGFVLLSWLKR